MIEVDVGVEDCGGSGCSRLKGKVGEEGKGEVVSEVKKDKRYSGG